MTQTVIDRLPTLSPSMRRVLGYIKNSSRSILTPAVICSTDDVLLDVNINEPAHWVIQSAREAGFVIVLITNRSEKHREATVNWLAEHQFRRSEYELYMRFDLDTRPITVIKGQIYDEFVKGRYKMFFVLENDPQTAEMWTKEKHLQVLQPVIDG